MKPRRTVCWIVTVACLFIIILAEAWDNLTSLYNNCKQKHLVKRLIEPRSILTGLVVYLVQLYWTFGQF